VKRPDPARQWSVLEFGEARRSHGGMHSWTTLLAVAGLALACAGPKPAALPLDGRPGNLVTEQGDGTAKIVGVSRSDAREALSDALNRANAYGRERGLRATPLRIEPGEGSNALGQPVFTCGLTFKVAPEPTAAGPAPTDHSASAFEHRMRLLVDAGVITIEEYSRLMAGHPGAMEAALRR